MRYLCRDEILNRTRAMNLDMLDFRSLLQPLEALQRCNICPRHCNASRLEGKKGYCKADASFSISSIVIHHGEEPVISGDRGICNIFFTNCNLQCIYCQNHQISCNTADYSSDKTELKEVLKRIIAILDTGIDHVGFVSPSHFIPQVKIIVTALRQLGRNPVTVYNTNGYDTVESLRGLEPYIDVYLPDYKYADAETGKKYSDVKDYPEVALAALKEMYRQKGDALPLNDRGYAVAGIIVRHLVLPGHPVNSIRVLRTIAEEVSPKLHISLMSQYYPTYKAGGHPNLGRTINSREYQKVLDEMQYLGLENGWVQELSSHESYRPDFEAEKPFE